MFCEEKKSVNGNSVWVNADFWKMNPYHKIFDDEKPYELMELYGDRNYSMFTALCGVRDYSGKSPKISEPRGIPDDATELVKQECDYWDCDGHSHSYCTLLDVKKFVEGDNYPVYTGLITPEQAKALDEDGIAPDCWCQGSSRDDLVRREWKDTTFNALTGLYEAMLERYAQLSFWGSKDRIPEEQMENFRIVFWFDN